jgi:hypothetical protein
MYWCKYHIYQNFKKCQKNGKTWTPCHCVCQRNLSKIYVLLSNLKKRLSKTIFISHHVMCSLKSSYCNHLSNMLMNVKLIVIQLELNDIGYKLVFHNYSKFASNTWYTLICKFEKYKTNPQKITWVWTYIVYWIWKKMKNWKKMKIIFFEKVIS